MSDLFKKMLGHSESLFLDVLPLDPEFVPPIIQFRENEQSYVANCLKSLFDKRPGKNVFITGSPGIGKTVAVKAILNELDKETSEIYQLYVNCWKKDSPHKIILDICEQLDYRFVQNRTTDELVKEVSKIINKKAAVIVLDEADKIEDHSILYGLLEDLYPKAIILITNEKEWLKEIDNRIKSRLLPVIIEFKPYNFDETYKILKKRVEHAFAENVFDKAAFELIAEKTFQIGDLRTGLFLLKEAGEVAEGKASRKVEIEHANVAIEKLKEFKIRSSDSLEENEQDVLELIKVNSGKTTSEIFEAYKKNKGEKTYRTFCRRIQDLKKARVISTEEATWEGPGKVTKVYYGSIKKLSDF